MIIKSTLWRTLLVLFCFVFLNACSQIRPVKKPVRAKPAVSVSSKQGLWKKRQQVLNRKAAWNLNSKIALRYRADHWTFGLNWMQRALKQYVMQINNPVTGAVVAKLTRTNNNVSLLSDDGRTYRDSDEERLLLRQSGVKLPLKGMQHWVRGLTSPIYKVDKLVLDAKGRPLAIYQAGWKIAYSRYLSNNYNAMPRKVVITRNKDNVYLKMIAKQWH